MTVDSIGFTRKLTDALRERIGGRLGISAEKVMVCFSHTHAAPEAESERGYYEEACSRIADAAVRARSSMVPVTAGWGNAHADIGVNRRWISEETDDRIGILKICDEQSEDPKLLILRVTAHGNVLKRDNLMVSPDYFGNVRDTAGKRFCCPVMVIQGSAGNTAPRFFCSEETPVDATGERYIRSRTALQDMADLITDSAAEVFGTIVQRKDPVARMYSVHTVLESDVPGKDEALRVAEDAKTQCGIDGSGWLSEVERLWEAGIRIQREDVEIQYFSVGSWCLCGGAYEFMTGFALETERTLKDEFFYANGYTNGCQLYFPTDEEFDAGGYEVFWSMLIYYPFTDRVYPFRRGSAGKLIRFMTEHAPEH